MRQQARVSGRPRTRGGFTLIEALFASVIMAVLFVAALNTVAAAKTGQYSATERILGQQTGLDLINEMLSRNYPPAAGQTPFALEPRAGATVRASWWNVDNYNGLVDSPPSDSSGNPLTGFSGWSRTVSVGYADSTSLAPVSSATDTGLKIITVTVLHGPRTIASFTSYRSSAWVNTIPTPNYATGNHPPVAAVSASKTSGSIGKSSGVTIGLDASASTDPDGDTLSYTWNFGDGGTAAGATVTHTYTQVGTYNAVVSVYDGRGGLSTATVVISIDP